MINEFKTFIMRGNIVDLAVAVVIGTAFNDIVKSFTEKLINPIVASFGGANVNGLAVQLGDNEKTVMDFGSVITATINFLIVAAVVYFIFVLPLKTLNEKRQRGEEPAPEAAVVPDDVLLLQEIRDLLAQRTPGAGPMS